MITVQLESMEAIRDDIKPLLKEHWEVTVLYKDKLSLEDNDVDETIEKYKRMEEEGLIHVITVRDDDELIGYNFLVTFSHPHYNIQHGTCDMMYVHPEYRGQGVGKHLIAFTEEYFGDLGGGVLSVNFKTFLPQPSLGDFGFVHAENVYTKVVTPEIY